MKIRIKNDITLDLSIFRPDKLPENLADAMDMKVILSCRNREFIPSFTHEENKVLVYFLASMQAELGNYKLTLQYSKLDPSMPEGKTVFTVDYCDAFKLVGDSCEADTIPESGIYTISLLMEVDRVLVSGGSSGGTTNYEELSNNLSK